MAWVEPSPEVVRPEERRRARLLAAMLLGTLPLALAASLLAPALSGSGGSPWTNPLSLAGLATTALGVLAYGLARTRHHQAAGALYVALAAVGVWAPVLLSAGTPNAGAAPYFVGLAVLLGSVFLPLRATAAFAAANLAALLVLPRALPGLGHVDAGNAGVFLVFVSAFVLLFAGVRQRDLRLIEAQHAALAEREETLRTVMDHAPSIIMLVARDGTIRYINRVVGGGAAPEDVEGTALYHYLAPDDARRVEALLLQAFATGQAQSYEVLAPDLDGRMRWWSSRMGPVLHDGRVAAVTLITTDVTDLKEAEAERLQARERAAELQRREDMARFQEGFVNMAAHELRTPLVPIRTQAFLLRRALAGKATPQEQEALDALDRGVRRLHDLVRDLLDGARLRAGRLELAVAPVDVGALAEEAVALHRALAAERGLDLAAAAEPGLAVEGDAMRLSQVLANLVGNAVKYTAPGGRVEVRAAREGPEVVVRVRDTGAGIAPEELPRLFRPFGQLGADAGRRADSTGLGLYLAKEFVERHGGRIWAASEGRGRGAEFAFALPAAAPDGAPAATATAVETA